MKISFNHISESSSYVLDKLEVYLVNDKGSLSLFTSDKDYRTTNNFINSLNVKQPFRDYVNKKFFYDGVCHWQFFPSYVWPYVFFIIEVTKILENLFTQNALKKLEYVCVEGMYGVLFLRVLEDFCKKNACHLDVVYAKKSKSKIYFSLKKFVRFCYNFVRDMGILVALHVLKKLDHTQSKKILLFSHKRNLGEIKNKIYDSHVGPIYESFKSQYTPILTLTDSQNLKIFIRLFFKNKSFESMIYFASPFSLLKSCIYSCWRLVKKPDIPCSFELFYKKIDLFPAFSIVIEHIEKNFFFETVYFRMACKELLTRLKPKALFLTYETGPVQRSAIIEASRLQIPTFGLQHGMIFSNHYDYAHSHVTQKFGEWGMQIPTYLLLFGSFWKRVLKKFKNYPDESMCVVGNWTVQKKSSFKRLLPTTPGTQKVLLLTNWRQSAEFLKSCKEALKNFNNITLIHKPHPSEATHTKHLEQREISLVSGSIEDVLCQVDYVISTVSTAVLDSIFHKKPVICFNHTKQKGWEEFYHIKGCFYCETEEQLAEIYTKLINLSSDEKEALFKAMEKTSKSFFECFGKEALENILKVLEQKI